MVKRVSAEDIKVMNELYAQCHNYSQVSRETGFAPSTVKKYIIKGYIPKEDREILRFIPSSIPEFTGCRFNNIENYGDLCVLSSKEEEEIKQLWKELDA